VGVGGRKEGRKKGIVTQQAEERTIFVMPLQGERKKSIGILHPNIFKEVN
jgi:hypothetical protein